ncbi:unnamed protein product [Leptosia nina]|uniref:Uncharacterized protein n=1 Tax=Leptosia nina TaxID=320188 RepID=A0AAV1JK27_9NEOP
MGYIPLTLINVSASHEPHHISLAVLRGAAVYRTRPIKPQIDNFGGYRSVTDKYNPSKIWFRAEPQEQQFLNALVITAPCQSPPPRHATAFHHYASTTQDNPTSVTNRHDTLHRKPANRDEFSNLVRNVSCAPRSDQIAPCEIQALAKEQPQPSIKHRLHTVLVKMKQRTKFKPRPTHN